MTKTSKDFVINDQLRRASLSVMNNIAEGYSRYYNKDKYKFLNYAVSSATEVISMTYVLEDIDFCHLALIENLRNLAHEVHRTTMAFANYYKTREN